MNVLDEYVREEGGPRYKLEMQRFPEVYQVALHLNEYVDALREAAKLDAPSEADLFDPRRSAALSGSGIGDAPPLGRAIGIGRHFLLRELVRRGVLSNPALHPLCYVPLRRVRLLVSGWGGNGESSFGIYKFLAQHLGEEAATFGGSLRPTAPCRRRGQDRRSRTTTRPPTSKRARRMRKPPRSNNRRRRSR